MIQRVLKLEVSLSTTGVSSFLAVLGLKSQSTAGKKQVSGEREA